MKQSYLFSNKMTCAGSPKLYLCETDAALFDFIKR